MTREQFEGIAAEFARRLVRRLMDETAGPARYAHAGDLTVMFTDVVGFTYLSEVLPPAEIVALLNAQFEIINRIVETEEGTLDKFIGDAAMALWGAPDPMPDHAARTCRAALAIAEAVTTLANSLMCNRCASRSDCTAAR